jgi:hypothetical protein
MRRKDPFLIIAIVTLVLMAMVFVASLTENERSGTLKITVTGTRGVFLGHLGEGRVITGSYQADAPLNIYLLTSAEAEDLRNPSYYVEPSLPEPISSGREGFFRTRIDESGTYEIIFWNESFNRNHEVNYSIDTGKRIRETPFIVSLVSLLILTVSLVMIAYFRRRTHRSSDDQTVHR